MPNRRKRFMNTAKIAKFLMKLFERHPVSPSDKVTGLNEVFRHPNFIDGSESEKKKIMFESSRFKFQNETEYPWDQYFGIDLRPLLKGKAVLDIGCHTGGRSAAWAKMYNFSKLYGIDVEQNYIEAAIQFKDNMGFEGNFKVAQGEILPFENDKFDAVVSFDVFEHVQNLEQTLNECYRVLKRGGMLFLVFPGYFHPFEHHLSLVSRIPCIHYFFSGNALIKAYNEILEERGNGANWYKRHSPNLEKWEKGNTINGTTSAQFRRLIRKMDWKIILQSKKPLGAVGRGASRKRLFRAISLLLSPLASIPIIEEFVLHRITYILQK